MSSLLCCLWHDQLHCCFLSGYAQERAAASSLREHNADLSLPCCPLPTPAAAANEKKAVGGVKGGQIGGEVSLCLQTHNALMLGPQCAVTSYRVHACVCCAVVDGWLTAAVCYACACVMGWTTAGRAGEMRVHS
jgi:hypothetical protein